MPNPVTITATANSVEGGLIFLFVFGTLAVIGCTAIVIYFWKGTK